MRLWLAPVPLHALQTLTPMMKICIVGRHLVHMTLFTSYYKGLFLDKANDFLQDGEERVLGYFSSALSSTEPNYCVNQKEFLAVVRAVNLFHPYVWGRPVILHTDNAAVLWTKRLKQPSGQMACWLSDVDCYDLHVRHCPGRVHWNADALSRRPCTQCGNEAGLCDAEVSSSFPCRLADFPVL